MTKEKTEIVLFETEDKNVSLSVEVKDETVWLNRNQMAELFDRDVKTIGKHINNALKEELYDEKSVVANFATTQIKIERTEKIIATIKYIRKCIRWSWQRIIRGYADCDKWSMYNFLQNLIPEMLQDMRNNRHGSPLWD